MVVSSGSMVKTSGCSESVVITTSPKSASIACARATPAAAASQWAAWQRRPRCRAAGYWPGLTGPERESSASWHPPHSCCGSGQFLVNRAAAAAAADLKGDVVADSNPWPHEVPALERVDRLPSRPWNSCERTGQSQVDGSATGCAHWGWGHCRGGLFTPQVCSPSKAWAGFSRVPAGE